MKPQDKKHLKKIQKEKGFKDEELLSSEKVKVYEAPSRPEGKMLVPADITQEEGIEVSGFDETINKMNEIEEAILWGEDE